MAPVRIEVANRLPPARLVLMLADPDFRVRHTLAERLVSDTVAGLQLQKRRGVVLLGGKRGALVRPCGAGIAAGMLRGCGSRRRVRRADRRCGLCPVRCHP